MVLASTSQKLLREAAATDDLTHVMVVDDRPEICDLIRQYLSDEGFRVSTASGGAEMREVMAREPVHLVILDLVLPGEDGLQLMRDLRTQSDIGIIIVTGRGDPIDRVVALEMGADDYLTKPFHPRELLARVRSVLRRCASAAEPDARQRIRFSGWTLDLSSHQLLSPAGEEVRLTAGEFELLAIFADNANRVLSRDRLLDLSRHREAGPFDRTIDVQIARLRRKLGDDGKNPSIIKTVRGGGYMLIAEAQTDLVLTAGAARATPGSADRCASRERPTP